MLISVDDLKNLFDMVDVSHDFLELLHNNCLFYNLFYLFDSFVLILDLDDFLLISDDLFDFFYNDWNFDDLVNDLFYVSVDIDQLRDDSLDFEYLWNFDNDFLGSFDLLNLWNGDCSFDNLFNDLLSSDNLLHD